uniref:HSF-type DNA-binding domain-containing protein n=1 Tax=Corethron hystrix TaxID=216773 RepID=A0A7S1BES7_9STRA|mmetsp:Transcript_24951/g.57643  ORF Transcript_24951/g.57643 Transcript_24951/m.57643 type:complete len:586 (+) Transcript_24951:289-2046(+)
MGTIPSKNRQFIVDQASVPRGNDDGYLCNTYDPHHNFSFPSSLERIERTNISTSSVERTITPVPPIEKKQTADGNDGEGNQYNTNDVPCPPPQKEPAMSSAFSAPSSLSSYRAAPRDDSDVKRKKLVNIIFSSSAEKPIQDHAEYEEVSQGPGANSSCSILKKLPSILKKIPPEESKRKKSQTFVSQDSQEIKESNKKKRREENSGNNVVELNYRDLSSLDTSCFPFKRLGRGHAVQFPEKVHTMLKETSCDPALFQIVSWKSHGRAFRVYNTQKFVDIILKDYFKQSKWTSFQRQLNTYGFKRMTQGVDSGSYYHECFLRGVPSLCSNIDRIEIKGKKEAASNPIAEPDFYSMPYSPVPCTTSEPEINKNMPNAVSVEVNDAKQQNNSNEQLAVAACSNQNKKSQSDIFANKESSTFSCVQGSLKEAKIESPSDDSPQKKACNKEAKDMSEDRKKYPAEHFKDLESYYKYNSKQSRKLFMDGASPSISKRNSISSERLFVETLPECETQFLGEIFSSREPSPSSSLTSHKQTKIGLSFIRNISSTEEDKEANSKKENQSDSDSALDSPVINDDRLSDYIYIYDA